LNGDLTHTRHDLICESDEQVLGLAAWYVARFKDDELRFDSVTLRPRAKPPSLFPKALGLRVRDLISVVRRPPGGGTITRECFVSGISHTFDQGGEWTATLELTSATPFRRFATSRWDVATWDGDPWFF
jgi:hypothetical protein